MNSEDLKGKGRVIFPETAPVLIWNTFSPDKSNLTEIPSEYILKSKLKNCHCREHRYLLGADPPLIAHHRCG
jgi:hypothetical protein